jgi:tRNA (guanine-N7-)-methyltransferase
LAIEYEDEIFLLEIKKREDSYLVKPDIISRPLDVNKIKKMLARLVEDAELKVLHSNIALSTSRPPLAKESNKRVEDFEYPEFTKERIAIEVGFGSGRHLLYQARQNPEILYIGIEIHTPSAQQVLKQIELQGLENIWVINYDARLLLEMMPSNSCERIFVHFPVPWDKKPHRRVISGRFLEESLRVLEVDGELELRTDSDNYYTYALEIFSAYPKISFKVEKNLDMPIKSKYEERWRAQQKDIYTISVRSESHSIESDRDYDFSFECDNNKIDGSVHLPRDPILKDGYFVHFERRYMIVGSNRAFLRCAFGSFDKPEHKYLHFSTNGLLYYPENPVRTEPNYRAHKEIGELVNG